MNAGVVLSGEDGGRGSLSEEGAAFEEKQGRAVNRQAGVGPPLSAVRQSALWLTFEDADLEARFLASQAARAAPISLGFAAFGLVLLLLLWTDPTLPSRSAIAVGLATLILIIAMHLFLRTWWEEHHELLSGAGNALMMAIIGWHMMLCTASPMTNAEAKALMGSRILIYTIHVHACADVVHKFRFKALIMKALIMLPISVCMSQQVMILFCQYTPTSALAVSATVIVLASIAMQAVIRHWESGERASFLEIVRLQS